MTKSIENSILNPQIYGAYLIAEIGINHNGDFDLAVKSIEEAAKAGANAVKFQNWKADDFISDKEAVFTYQSQGKKITESFYDLCKRNEMKSGWIEKLHNVCRQNNVQFISTPTTKEGVQDLINSGVSIIKNGSDYLCHTPLIEYMANHSKILILSTGMGDKNDISHALKAAQKGNAKVALLHCTSMYPTPPEDINIQRMVSLQKEFKVPVGFSDHSSNEIAAVQAVTLGATIIEKHFTLDKSLAGPDHWFSSTPSEFNQLVKSIRQAEKQLGRPNIIPATGEEKNKLEFRLSAIAKKDLTMGHILREEDIMFKKPGTGISPSKIENYYGKKINKDITIGTPIKEHFFK